MGHSVIQQGCSWIIDDGVDVHVWGDKWLPNLPSGKITSPPHPMNPHMKVMELINPHTMTWDLHMIEGSITQEEKQAILNLPLKFIYA